VPHIEPRNDQAERALVFMREHRCTGVYRDFVATNINHRVQ
jgi:hypothetical protein